LNEFLTTTLSTETIETIVVGYPKTMRGTESDQTKKVVEHVEELKKLFPAITFQLWDERLTSKMATGIKKEKTKEDKLRGHSIAAALILESYLSYLQNKKDLHN
jgi:putative Holliday junction resolvase